MSRTIYLLSDAHLGASQASREQEKLARLGMLFRKIGDDRASLIILGDLFDFWFEYRTVVQKEHLPVIRMLAELRSRGVDVTYLVGNHDFWLGDFLTRELGITVVRDSLILDIDRNRIFLAHGDGLGPGDLGYKFLKLVLRSPVSIWLYRLLHPDLAIPLAKWCSWLSRNHWTKEKYLASDPLWLAAREKFGQGYNVVVFGHVHIPALRRDGGNVYLNLGDFISHFSYGLYKDGLLRLERLNVT